MNRAGLITDCMDLISGFSLYTSKEQIELLQNVINVLGSYPKPQKKGSTEPGTKKDIGAYLFVSNVRNACKLTTIEMLDEIRAYNIIQINLERAYSLLLDN